MREIVLLHGWTKQASDYGELMKLIGGQAFDLPGFGAEKLPRPYTLDDYVNFVTQFIEKKKLEDVVLVGHSFGGRIAIKIAARNPEFLKKLILVDAGGVKEMTWKMKLAARLPRLGSFGRDLFGSSDYLAASGDLRETLKSVVNEDLVPLLSKIKTPTLVIWGRQDNTTPFWMGKVMHEKIEGSKFIVIGGDHGIPYRKPKEVAAAINTFI